MTVKTVSIPLFDIPALGLTFYAFCHQACSIFSLFYIVIEVILLFLYIVCTIQIMEINSVLQICMDILSFDLEDKLFNEMCY